MAGLDFDVSVRAAEHGFAKSLLRLAQRLAQRRNLRFTYRWRDTQGYYVTVDGSLQSMQSCLEVLVVALLSYAEGHSHFLQPTKRRGVARRITKAFAEALDEITNVVHHVSELVGGTPSSYSFDTGGATHLQGPLNEFSAALTLYDNGRLTPSQLAEQSHTSVELLMRNALVLGKSDLAFESMVHRCHDEGFIEESLVSSLVKLKNLRRGAKHRGQGISQQRMDELLPSVISALHRLTRVIRRKR